MGGEAEADVSDADATTAAELPEPGGATRRSALIAFVLIEVAGFFTYLHIGRFMWFYGDDWKPLAGRKMGDLFGQHGGHLIAVPVAVFRVMFFLFGLRSYTPYLVMIVSLHIAVAALLRVIMRRAGVGPWVATAAATLYVFFGAGGQNALWAFQITFVGAVTFGLLQLVLSDHDGRIDRRDWFGLLFGLLSIMCAGVAITMVAVVGIASVIRGRWRAALFHTAPLGALWGIWSLRYGAETPFATSPGVLFDWDRRGVGELFRSLGYWAPIGVAFAAMLIVGLVVALKQSEPGWRARAAVPLATLVGVLIFFTITGASRAFFGIGAVYSSRYLDIAAVLVLPAVAVAADALARRHRALFAVVLLLFFVGIPGNISQTSDPFPNAVYFRRYRQTMLSLPRMSLAPRVPGSLQPEPNNAPDVTVAWLLEGARSGRIPKTRTLTPTERLTNILRLSLDQTKGSAGAQCKTVHPRLVVKLRNGQAISVRGRVLIRLVFGGMVSSPVAFGASFLTGAGEHKLKDVAGSLELRIARGPQGESPSVCGIPRGSR